MFTFILYLFFLLVYFFSITPYKHFKQDKLDAIDEEINKLKSVNEKKQEEIDLEKKRQALENARNQKNVRVYDSERGWIYETNREDIDKAQDDYDKAVTDKQISALEDIKDAINNGTNTAHSDAEDVDIQSQVDSLMQGKGITSAEDILKKFNIPYDPEKFNSSNAWEHMLDSWCNPTSFLKSALQSNEVVNNNNQNVSNAYGGNITINVGKIVTDNPQDFIEQMGKVVKDMFPDLFDDRLDLFGRNLKMYRMNHS